MKHYIKQFFAALVCCSLLLAFFTTAGVNAEGVVISGADSILIYNPRPAGSKLATGTLPKAETANGTTELSLDTALPGALAHPIVFGDRSTLAQRRQTAAHELTTNYNVSDTKNFIVYSFDDNSYYSLEFTLYAMSDTCYVWVYEGANADQKLSSFQATELCSSFTNRVYASVNTHFGPFRDTDGSGHVNILTFPMSAGIAGYFDPYDLYTRAEIQLFDPEYVDSYNCAPIINVNSIYANYTQVLLSTLAHEFQHLVNFSSALKAPANKNLFDNGVYSPLWLDEAFAMESEELIYPGEVETQGYIDEFNSDKKVVGGGSSLTTFNNELSEYARGFLFSEYIKHQSGSSAVFRKVLQYWSAQEELSALNAEAALQYALNADTIARVNELKYTNTVSGEFLSKLTLSFYLSLVMHQEQGLFSLPASCDSASFPYFNGTSATIDGGGAILVASDGSFEVPENAGNGLIYIGIKDGSIVASYGLSSGSATAKPSITPTATPTSTATIPPTSTPMTTATPTATATVTAGPPQPILYGDANGDKVLGASDAALILRHLVDLEYIAEENLIAANCDRSDELSAHDAALILRHLVGLESIKQD